MTSTSTHTWDEKRTVETRTVEEALREAGFKQVDAYRYNSASIRVRVIDPQFENLPPEKRDALVEPHLEQLDKRTQADIVNLFTFAPSEIQESLPTFRVFYLNQEFEHPSPSLL